MFCISKCVKESVRIMASISKIKQPTYYPTYSRSSMISNIKMEIAKVNAQAKHGLISQDEAQMKLAFLEAKLSALESGQNVDGVQFEKPESIKTDTPSIGNLQATNNENSNDNTDAQQRQEAFFEQQATYNRMFHNI